MLSMQKLMAQKMQKRKGKNAGGRPPKFAEPSRAITLTLPERTLRLLESLESDRAKSITKAVDWATRSIGTTSRAIEVVEVEKGRAVIVVGPSRYLRELPWLRMVEIAPSRFLLVIPTGTAIETLEVAIMDMTESLPKQNTYEQKLLTELRSYLTLQRRSKKVSKAELLLVDTSNA